MISLARASIRVDWRRNMSILIILSLSGLVLAGLIAWMNGTILAGKHSILNSQADLWVTKIGRYTNDGRERTYQTSPRPEDQNVLWLHPSVVGVKGLLRGRRYALNMPDGTKKRTEVTLIDLEPNSIAYPKDAPLSLSSSLAPAFTIAMAKNYATELGFSLNTTFQTDDNNELTIVELTPIILNGSTPQIYMSEETYTLLTGQSSRESQILIKLKDPSKALEVRDELIEILKDKSPDLRIWTPEGYLDYLESQVLDDEDAQGILLNIIIGFAFFVFMVTGQLMRSNIHSQIKEFGTLHALGIPKVKLAFITMSQGFWLGITSITLCTVMYYGVKYLSAMVNEPLIMPVYGWVVSYGLIMSVAMISGFTSMFVLRKIELTSLLR